MGSHTAESKNIFGSYAGHPGEIVAGVPCSAPLVATLRELERLLQESYGRDFSYTVCGRGHVLAASNLELGQVTPVSTPPQEE